MQTKDAWTVVRRSFTEWQEDSVPRLGAALAYYAIFSLAPLVLIAIGIAGLFFQEATARAQVMAQLRESMGPQAAEALGGIIDTTARQGGVATTVGLVVLLFAASGVFVELQAELNTIWKVTPRPGRAWLTVVKERVAAFAIVLVAGLLLLALLVAGTVVAALTHHFPADTLPGGPALWQVGNSLVSFLFVTLAFALVFKYLPDIKIAWADVWVGAAVTAVLFTLGKYLLGLYLARSSTTSAFGAAGSLVLLLVWVYYSAQILLFGAEFIRVYTHYAGRQVEPADNAICSCALPPRPPLHPYETVSPGRRQAA